MIERLIERCLFLSRWLLAPIYLGLSLMLMALVIKFFQELAHTWHKIMDISEADTVLYALSLVDMALVASLIIMVMFSGYENFVSKIDLDENDEKLEWHGKLDANTLKLKVAASIVAISSIHLLKIFMRVPEYTNDQLFWFVTIHITFVVSALMLAILDRIAFPNKHKAIVDPSLPDGDKKK